MYLRSRQKLLDAARDMVGQTYSFKKGKSRSKKYCTSQPVFKRPKLSFDARVDRMKELEEEVKNIKDRISYKEKRCQMAENVKNYKTCDELTEEITEVCKKRREIENKLTVLEKKTKKSKVYMSKKHYNSSDDSSVRSKPVENYIHKPDQLLKPQSLSSSHSSDEQSRSKRKSTSSQADDSDSSVYSNESFETILLGDSNQSQDSQPHF